MAKDKKGVWSTEKEAKAAIKATYTDYKGKTFISNTSITRMGDDGNTMLAQWQFGLPNDQIDHFNIDWEYYDTALNKWIQGNGGTSSVSPDSHVIIDKKIYYQDEFTIPSIVTVNKIRFAVEAISKTHEVTAYYYKKTTTGSGKNKKTKTTKTAVKQNIKYWNVGKSGWKTYVFGVNTRPAQPPAPSAKMNESCTGVTVTWDGFVRPTTCVVLWRYRDDKIAPGKMEKAGPVDDSNLHIPTEVWRNPDGAMFTDMSIEAGHKYRYRMRAHNHDALNTDVEWSYSDEELIENQGTEWFFQNVLSDEVQTRPLDPLEQTAAFYGMSGEKARIKVTWKDNGWAGESYEVRYAESLDLLKTDGGYETSSVDLDYIGGTINSGGPVQSHILEVEPGSQYWFRVVVKNSNPDEQGYSAFGRYATCIAGSKPDAPTLGSTNPFYVVGDEVPVSWTHNPTDNSEQTKATVEYIFKGEVFERNIETGEITSQGVQEIKNSISIDGATSSAFIPTFWMVDDVTERSVGDGTTLKWRVQTKGASDTWSDWSAYSESTILAPPQCHVNIMYANPDYEEMHLLSSEPDWWPESETRELRWYYREVEERPTIFQKLESQPSWWPRDTEHAPSWKYSLVEEQPTQYTDPTGSPIARYAYDVTTSTVNGTGCDSNAFSVDKDFPKDPDWPNVYNVSTTAEAAESGDFSRGTWNIVQRGNVKLSETYPIGVVLDMYGTTSSDAEVIVSFVADGNNLGYAYVRPSGVSGSSKVRIITSQYSHMAFCDLPEGTSNVTVNFEIRGQMQFYASMIIDNENPDQGDYSALLRDYGNIVSYGDFNFDHTGYYEYSNAAGMRSVSPVTSEQTESLSIGAGGTRIITIRKTRVLEYKLLSFSSDNDAQYAVSYSRQSESELLLTARNVNDTAGVITINYLLTYMDRIPVWSDGLVFVQSDSTTSVPDETFTALNGVLTFRASAPEFYGPFAYGDPDFDYTVYREYEDTTGMIQATGENGFTQGHVYTVSENLEPVPSSIIGNDYWMWPFTIDNTSGQYDTVILYAVDNNGDVVFSNGALPTGTKRDLLEYVIAQGYTGYAFVKESNTQHVVPRDVTFGWDQIAQMASEGYEFEYEDPFTSPAFRTSLFYGGSPDSIEQWLAYEPGSTITRLPLLVSLTASGTDNQTPIAWSMELMPSETFVYTGVDGNDAVALSSSPIFSASVDASDGEMFDPVDQRFLITAADGAFVSGQTYYITGRVTTDAGLTSENDTEYFTVEWDYDMPDPTITGIFNEDDYTVTLFYGCFDAEGAPVPDVTLDIYRINYDSTLTLIGDNLPNAQVVNDEVLTSSIIDLYPSFTSARYRIVANELNTDQTTAYDSEEIPTPVYGIFIQWDAQSPNWDADLDSAVYSGEQVFLRWDLDITEDAEPDRELVEYIGRENPVAYFGTQLGVTGSWTSNLVKWEQQEEIAQLRKLQRWQGTCYVRETSGAGYRAVVSVSFGRSIDSLKVPVTLEITKVEE